MIPKNIKVAQIVGLCTGSISFLASAFLCFTIWVSPKGLKTPYSRIIFGFSIADILQSIGVVLSPFLSPADNPDTIFSRGTVASCEGIGLFLLIGSHAILLYILFLTYYFLKRVKFKQTPQDFAKCEEKFIFAFIWIYAIATSIYPLIKGQINATQYGSVCLIVPRPFDCGVDSGKECIRGETANRSSLLSSIVPIVIVFMLLIIVLGTFTCYIYSAEKAIQPSENVRRKKNDNLMNQEHDDGNKENDEDDDCEEKQDMPSEKGLVIISHESPVKDEEPEQVSPHSEESANDVTAFAEENITPDNNDNAPDTKRTHEGMDLTKRAAHQSILYILAFMLVYSGPVLSILMRLFANTENRGAILFWFISLFYPIGGFLNMVIYTRPKVQALKKLIPELPIIICFLIVILAGGETPSLADLGLEDMNRPNSTPPQQEQQHQQEEEELEEDPSSCHHVSIPGDESIASSNISYWLRAFGYVSEEDERDFDGEVDELMRGLGMQ